MDLQNALEQYRDAEFNYGTLDCCLFVLNVVRDFTGIDYAEPWRGRYSSERGALKIIMGYGGMSGLVSAVLGRMIRPIWSVKPGDPVLIGYPLVEQDSIGGGLGIYDGSTLVYLTEKGLATAPVLWGKGCWHV